MEGAGHLPTKKTFFVPKMISLGAFCCSFQQAENTDTQLKPWDTDFMVQSRNETYKNSAEITQNSRSHQRGAVAPSPRPLNTPLIITPSFAITLLEFVIVDCRRNTNPATAAGRKSRRVAVAACMQQLTRGFHHNITIT